MNRYRYLLFTKWLFCVQFPIMSSDPEIFYLGVFKSLEMRSQFACFTVWFDVMLMCCVNSSNRLYKSRRLQEVMFPSTAIRKQIYLMWQQSKNCQIYITKCLQWPQACCTCQRWTSKLWAYVLLIFFGFSSQRYLICLAPSYSSLASVMEN